MVHVWACLGPWKEQIMTISTTLTRVGYTCDGATTVFNVTFPFFDSIDLEVIERVTATGVETVKVSDADYTVTGGGGATGTVVAAVAPLAGLEWHVRRATGRVQQTDYTANDPFPAETHETALDRLTAIAQELDEQGARALQFPATDSTSLSAEIPSSISRASAYLAFDANGNPIASAGPTGDSAIPVTSYIETLLDDSNAATARATLGLGDAALGTIGSTVQAYDADTLKADTADELTAGFSILNGNLGTLSSGTVTLDFADGNIQVAGCNGAFTLQPPASSSGTIMLRLTNGASAGTVTASGFSVVTGDAMTTTSGHSFFLYATRDSVFSHLHVVAMQ